MKVSVSNSVQNINDFDDIREEDIDHFSDRCSSFQDLFHMSDADTKCQEKMMENDFLSEASFEFKSLGLDLTPASTSPPIKKDKNEKNSSTRNQTHHQHVKKTYSAGNSLRVSQLDNVKKLGASCAAPSEDFRCSGNKFSSDDDDDDDDDDDKNGDSNYSVKSRSKVVDGDTKPKVRPYVKRLRWNNEDMQKAMECVNKKEMTMRGAAKKYNVPYSTLKDRIRERVKHGTRPGVKTILNSDEELRLVKIVNYMEDCGFNVQRKDIRTKAHEILILKNGNPSSSSMPGHNWLTGFLERHNECKVDKSPNRNAVPNAALNRFFEVTSQVYTMIPSNERPSRIYCMTSVQLPSLPKTSIILTASADGSLLAPYVVGNFDRNSLQSMNQIFPSAMWASSDTFNSGVDKAVEEKHIKSWFSDLFLARIKSTAGHNNTKIRALFINIPTSNVAIKLIEQAIEEKVHLINMPSNLTKDLQPIDSSLISSIDKYVFKFLSHLQGDGNQDNIKCLPSASQIAKILKKIFEKSELFRKEIIENFRRMGLYPLKSHYPEREEGGNRKLNFNENFTRKNSPVGSDESNNVSNSGFSIIKQTFQDLSNFGSVFSPSFKRLLVNKHDANNTEVKKNPSLKRSMSTLDNEDDVIRSSKCQRTTRNEVRSAKNIFSTIEDSLTNSSLSDENKEITIADFRDPDVISRAMASIMPDVQKNFGNKFIGDFDQNIKKEYPSSGLKARTFDNSKYNSTFEGAIPTPTKEKERNFMEMDIDTGFIKEEIIETSIAPQDVESQELIEEIVTDEMFYCDNTFSDTQDNIELMSGTDSGDTQQYEIKPHLNAGIICQPQTPSHEVAVSLSDTNNAVPNDHLSVNEEIILLRGIPLRASQRVQLTMKIMINNHPAEMVRQVTLKEALGLAENPALISYEISVM